MAHDPQAQVVPQPAVHKLFLNPLCELEHPGCLRIASEVHHRVAIEDGGDEYALDNLVSACKPCHSVETMREQRPPPSHA